MTERAGAGRATVRGTRFALAKFRPPALPATLIKRPELHELLVAGSGQRLTVVVGSAGAGKTVLLAGVGAVFVTFVFTTLIHEPASIATLAGILVLSVALDYGWKHFHDTRTKDVQLAH
jgi:hypothetical protein